MRKICKIKKGFVPLENKQVINLILLTMDGFYSKKLEEIYKTEGEIEVFIESTFDEISEKYTEHIIHFGDEKIVYSVEEERNNDLKLLKSLNWNEDLDLSFF